MSSINDESIWITDIKEGYEYLKDTSNFYSFAEGLTVLITKYGYDGQIEDTVSKTNFIISKLQSVDVSITKSTIKDWFDNKRRPLSGSRNVIFQICFSLSVSFEDIKDFFSRVYFERSFNCHTTEEAVYYYCFKRKLTYNHAKQLVNTINTFPVYKNKPSNVFTKEIINSIDHCSSDDELLFFFKENKSIFTQYNVTALDCINTLYNKIKGKKKDKDIIEAFKNNQRPDTRNCGLVIQEYLYSLKNGRAACITGRDITSTDFMLDQMITTNSGISKDTDIPDIVRKNFPSKKTFSDIMNQDTGQASYDSIRKCLILLKFYDFWVTQLLDPVKNEDKLFNIFDIYVEETNHILVSSGYEELFCENPYDWLFLWASTHDDPLGTLREAINIAISS